MTGRGYMDHKKKRTLKKQGIVLAILVALLIPGAFVLHAIDTHQTIQDKNGLDDDVVEINGKHGKVQEIGVRSTKLMLPGNNMLVLGNHCIEEVLNLTCKLSWCSVALRVPAQASLQKSEEALKRELPEISKRCDKIVGQLNYVGVTEIGGDIGTYMGVPTRTLTISAECREEDMYSVRLFINREICLLFEREGIELM